MAPPVRVLNVVSQMNRAGAETWLMQVLRNVDASRVRMEFLVTVAAPGHFDAEIRALGSAVIPCASPAHPARFAHRFLAVLREHGPYDVVHSHVHHFSGFVLALARRAKVPVRIAHSHLDTRRLDADSGFRRRVYLNVMRAAVHRYATAGLAVSGPAACALFGPSWLDDGRWRIVRCGLDFGPFHGASPAASIRAELGVPPDALVLGHVGRFDSQKNQGFLVGIAAEVFRREPRAFLVLVGDGPTRGSVETEARRLGIRERVAFAGVRSDVPRVLRSFDVFVLPSLREGLPLVGLEAQAAGLPIVLSDAVTRELVVIPGLFTWRSLSDPPESWAVAVLSAASRPRMGEDAAAALENSEFAVTRSVTGLVEEYERRA